jgi:hypothetical protein
MVRAAAAGVVDYSRADPQDGKWRIKHRLLLQELERQENYKLLDAVHRQWLSHVSHGHLVDESYQNVKTHANETLEALEANLFPWAVIPKPQGEKDTISPDAQIAIEKYKQYRASLQNGEDSDAQPT